MSVYLRRGSARSGRAGISAVLAVVLTLWAPAGLAREAPRYPELPNLHKVNDHLYRGGQPRNGGIRKLLEVGIRTIINLRGQDDLTRAEEAESKAAGLAYFSIPMAGLGRPTPQQISEIMAVIDAPENWPVFVHCKRGCDRTGTIIALYRISHDRWTADQAVSEAKRHGLSWFAFRMKDYISDHYRDSAKVAQRQGTYLDQ